MLDVLHQTGLGHLPRFLQHLVTQAGRCDGEKSRHVVLAIPGETLKCVEDILLGQPTHNFLGVVGDETHPAAVLEVQVLYLSMENLLIIIER